MLSNRNKLRVHFYRFSFLHYIQSMFRKEKGDKQFLSAISNIFNVQKLKTFNWFHSYETQCVYIRDRKILRKRERLDDCWFSAINRRGYKTNIYTYIYIYLGIYTILVRACLVRPMPNYHILILGLNGGLLVKHKKNTILLTSD